MRRIKSKPKTVNAKVSNEFETVFTFASLSLGYALGERIGLGIAAFLLLVIMFAAIDSSSKEKKK